MAVVISERLLDNSDRLLDAESDEQLVGMVQAGHQAAFAAIVRRYERELQAQARRLTFDGRGEDAVQQAFLNAFAALRGGREVRHLRGWLHQILRNEVRRARVPIHAPLEAAAPYGETLEDTVQRRATAYATLAELSALPDRQRDALLATAVLGFPRGHVARTMGLSEGAVRQLVHRARLRVRQAATALIPFPVTKLFGAARSGAAPDAALGAGAGAAAGGGLVIKVGALVASGVVVTGIAVTHSFPLRQHATVPAHGALHHSRARARGSSAPAASAGRSDPAVVTSALRLREHGPAVAGEDGRFGGGAGVLSGMRSGRHGEQGSRRGGVEGRGHDGSSSGRAGDSSGGLEGGTASGPGRGGDGSGSRSGTSSATGSRSGSDDGAASGAGPTGSGSGSGRGGDSGAPSGSVTGTTGSGSDDGAATSASGPGGSGHSGGSGSVTPIGGGPSTATTSGSSDSTSTVSATMATGGTTSGGDGSASDGSPSGGSTSGGSSDGSLSSGGK